MRLAIIISHPIQYYSPWFRFLAANGLSDMRVFYLWNGGVTEQLDRGFGVAIKWDVPLLEGYDYEFVPNRSSRPGTTSWRGLDNPSLLDRLATYQPDAILLFGYNYVTHYQLLLSRFARKIPLLFRGDSHRLFPEKGLRAWLRHRWVSQVLRRFDACLYVGQANKSYFLLHGIPERRLFFCPHTVDNERFISQAKSASDDALQWKISLGISPAQRVILFAGKFEPKKRPRDLIAAFLKAKLENTTLLMVGNGEQEKQLREDAAGHTNIVFAPFQNQTHMPRTYAAGDLFVLPSFGRGETWGLAINEAMCLGRPVIVSTHVGCAQNLVKSRQNGLIFPAGDVDALTLALQEALADPAQLESWGKRSLETIRDYDYAHATEGLLAALDFVKEERKPLSS